MALGAEVHELPAADAVDPRGPGEDFGAFGPRLDGQRRAQYGPKCLGLEGVAGQHGRALAEDLVVRRLAAAEIVVVHAGQVVVDERIGVQHLYGAGHGQGLFRL